MQDKKEIVIVNRPLPMLNDGHSIVVNDITKEVNLIFFQIDSLAENDKLLNAVATSNTRLNEQQLKQLNNDINNILKSFEDKK